MTEISQQSSSSSNGTEPAEEAIVSVQSLSQYSTATSFNSADDITSAGPISHGEVERVLNEYGRYVGNFQFDAARLVLEKFRSLNLTVINNPQDSSLASLFSALIQICTCDKNYYTLNLLAQTKILRRENPLRSQYMCVFNDLKRALSSTSSSSPSVIDLLLAQCQCYIEVRMEMIQYYNWLSTFTGSRTMPWSEIASKAETNSKRLKSVHHPLLEPLAHVLVEEIDILRLLISSQIHIMHCRMFESLVQLKEIRERFDFWIKAVESAVPRKKFLFYSYKGEPPRNRAINWFIKFYNLLMAKFSLYFTDVLWHYCSEEDIKAIHTIDNTFNYIDKMITFHKKTNAKFVAILYDRTKEADIPFYGFGYHRLTNRFNNENTTEPLQGYEATMPFVFRFPSATPQDPQKPMPSPTIPFDCHERIANFIINRLKGERKPESPNIMREYEPYREDGITLFGDSIEQDLYIVTLFVGNYVDDNEHIVTNFIEDFTNSLRGSKLFYELKITSVKQTAPIETGTSTQQQPPPQ